ncbi:M24 family metallopeptidase [Natrarchaeobaculum aegyptiacum]|uniref:Peptidase n=1 Tax=Natrarchaeobaculum aegyptiacum TaxID=745377 RepID=A0A2Z2HV25_9EURY|nr:M24 family metallopeptidase [Natrarchaeobaculum aegyptiacum]ARS91156.1 peptidase [Natrarchaeobaculum aegyptiacum]
MEKRERLERYLERVDLESVWFARPNAFAWLTGGSNVVDRADPVGVAAVGYDGSDVCVLTNNVEADRIENEELPDLDDAVAVEVFPWHETSLEAAIAERVDGPAAADIDVPGLERVDPTPLRQPLTARDRDRYRELGREVSRSVEAVCRELRPEDTEREVAAAVRVALSARGIEAPVVLVGGADRAGQYRHYTPTTARLGDYALVSVTAARAGLHASCTRTVAFDPPAWLERRHEAAARVETTALAATQAVGTVGEGGLSSRDRGTSGDVFAAIQDAYDAVSYPGEWEHHHQGGAAGYSGREWIATPDSEHPVGLPMAYAWNPTVEGAKSEGTVLVTGRDEDGDGNDTSDDRAENGFEPLTSTGDWPTITVEAIGYDLELERPAILEQDG